VIMSAYVVKSPPLCRASRLKNPWDEVRGAANLLSDQLASLDRQIREKNGEEGPGLYFQNVPRL
jgi:hypothetical protein